MLNYLEVKVKYDFFAHAKLKSLQFLQFLTTSVQLESNSTALIFM